MERPFDTLTLRGRERRLRRAAQAALERHGMGAARLRALSIQDNVVYRADHPIEGTWVVRVHGGEELDRTEIRSELAWLDALARDTDVVAPVPRRTADGDDAVEVEAPGVPGPRVCTVLRWVDGARRRRNPRPVHLERVGRTLAMLHAHAVSWTPPAWFRRPRWTADGVFGSEGFLGPGGRDPWPYLDDDLRPTFEEAAVRARAVFDDLGRRPEDVGLIHADLHLWNVLFRDRRAAAIDFDDCGVGPWAYDLASALAYLRGRSDWQPLREGFLRGYACVRPVPERHLASLDDMILGRLTGVALWGAAVYLSVNRDDPTIAPWIRGVEAQLRALMGHDG